MKLDYKAASVASLIAAVVALLQIFVALAVVAMFVGAVGVFAPKDKTTIGFRWTACAGFLLGLTNAATMLAVQIGATR